MVFPQKYPSECHVRHMRSDVASVKKANILLNKCVFKTIFCLSNTSLNGFQIEGCWERGGDFFQGQLQFLHKK